MESPTHKSLGNGFFGLSDEEWEAQQAQIEDANVRRNEAKQRRIATALQAGRTIEEIKQMDSWVSDLPVCYICGELEEDTYCGCDDPEYADLSDSEIVRRSPLQAAS